MDDPQRPTERRLFQRLRVRCEVDYVLTVPLRPPSAGVGHTVDVSAGGLLLDLPAPPQPLSAALLDGRGEVAVCLHLGGVHAPVKAACRVVWMSAPRSAGARMQLGLRFVDLDANERERLHAFARATSE